MKERRKNIKYVEKLLLINIKGVEGFSNNLDSLIILVRLCKRKKNDSEDILKIFRNCESFPG